MSLNCYYNDMIKKFTLVDFILIKAAYLFFALMLIVLYPPILLIDWWAFLIFAVLGEYFFMVRVFEKTKKKCLIDKIEKYRKSMNIIDFGLMFFCWFFIAAILAVLIPALTDISWHSYLVGYVVFAIKPCYSALKK